METRFEIKRKLGREQPKDENHKPPPTGQGLRIRLSVESTNPHIISEETTFISYDMGSLISLERRVKNGLNELVQIMSEIVEHQVAPRVKEVYFVNQK